MQGLPVREWRRGDFLLSTDVSLVDLDAVNTAFASDAMPWAVGLPKDTLRTAINSSLCFGLYHCPEEPQSGTATRASACAVKRCSLTTDTTSLQKISNGG